MTLADAIRGFAYVNFINPARNKGEKTVTIRAGDVHDAMDLESKMPSVCGAIGTNKFLKQYNLSLENREGPTCGANVYFTFELL